MTSELATLRLEPAVHTHTVVDGRVTRRPQSHFLDFLIDNVSLLRTAHGQGNLVTDLNRAWLPDDVASAIETLLGRRPAPELSEGRIPLLVCGECGDLACGAVTATLDVGASEVMWSDFRWENGYGEPEPLDTLAEPVRFDRAQYEAEFADAGHPVAALPEPEPLSGRGSDAAGTSAGPGGIDQMKTVPKAALRDTRDDAAVTELGFAVHSPDRLPQPALNRLWSGLVGSRDGSEGTPDHASVRTQSAESAESPQLGQPSSVPAIIARH